MITVDTSALIAAIDTRSAAHRAVVRVLEVEDAPLLLPAETLGEIGYFLHSVFPPAVTHAFLDDLESGAWIVDYSSTRISRIRELIVRYSDLKLDLVDAAVIACAEDNGGRVLTLDLRDFLPVAREGSITVLPQA